MESKIDSRKKDLKKSFDDPLRRRENQQIQIRKQTREAQLAKKRGADLTDDKKTSNEETRNVNLLNSNVALSQEYIDGLYSNDFQVLFRTAQGIRRLLSVENNPPIQEVIDANLVPRFVELLDTTENTDLQFECAWAITNVASGTAEQTQVVVASGAIPVLVRLMKSPNLSVREQAIWAIGNIAGDCTELRNLVITNGAVEPVLDELRNCYNENARISLIRYATWTASNFCRGRPEPSFEIIQSVLPILRGLLSLTDSDVLTDACWAISYLTDNADNQQSRIVTEVIKQGIPPKIIDLMLHNSFLVQTPALRALGNIVTGDDVQTQTMIHYGCLAKLKELLDSPRKSIRKEACWAISNITAGNKDQVQAVINHGIIPKLCNLLMNAEFEVRREAAWAIANACSGSSTEQISALIKLNVIKPLVNCLNVHDQKMILVALEAIKNILKHGAALMKLYNLPENPYVNDLEEANCFPILENMQYWDEKYKIQQLALQIMTEYLDIEEMDAPINNDNTNSLFSGMQ